MKTKLERLDAEIERLSARRQELWADDTRDTTSETSTIAAKLEELYETKRIEQAKARVGNREKITRRARVETELERLM